MCIRNRACQRCETCGRLKYQFWMSAEMHDRGCPFGHDRMDQCAETVDHARMLLWAQRQGATMTPTGLALIEQMQAAGVDLTPA